MPLHVNDRFSTWEDFFYAVEAYCDETYQPMVKKSCKKYMPDPNEEGESQTKYPAMLYSYYTYKCTHNGTFKPRGQGKRKTASLKEECKAKIRASLTKDKSALVVSQLVDTHNHPIEEELYRSYAQNRKLNEEEKKRVEELHRLNVPTKLIVQEIRSISGKPVMKQDIWNERMRLRSQGKFPIGWIDEQNDAQLVMNGEDKEYSESRAELDKTLSCLMIKSLCDNLFQKLVKLRTDRLGYYVSLLEQFEGLVNRDVSFKIVPEEHSSAGSSSSDTGIVKIESVSVDSVVNQIVVEGLDSVQEFVIADIAGIDCVSEVVCDTDGSSNVGKPAQKVAKKRGRPKKVVNIRCGICGLEEPDKRVAVWVGCDSCAQCFHSVCLSDVDISNGYVCSYCNRKKARVSNT